MSFRALCLQFVIILTYQNAVVSDTINLTATAYPQTFNSHDDFGNSPYPNNYSRSWLIGGENANYSIAITFLSCVMETYKELCLIDKVQVYDGPDSSSAPQLSGLQLCCQTQPGTLIATLGNPMFVEFKVDETETEAGFQISYILDGAPTSTLAPAQSTPKDYTLYIIIACSVVGFFLIVIIILVCCLCCKKSKKKKKKKRKIPKKKKNRSAPKPEVVTSDHSSNNEDSEGEGQQSVDSPPPAYTTVVNEEINQGPSTERSKGKKHQSSNGKVAVVTETGKQNDKQSTDDVNNNQNKNKGDAKRTDDTKVRNEQDALNITAKDKNVVKQNEQDTTVVQKEKNKKKKADKKNKDERNIQADSENSKNETSTKAAVLSSNDNTVDNKQTQNDDKVKGKSHSETTKQDKENIELSQDQTTEVTTKSLTTVMTKESKTSVIVGTKDLTMEKENEPETLDDSKTQKDSAPNIITNDHSKNSADNTKKAQKGKSKAAKKKAINVKGNLSYCEKPNMVAPIDNDEVFGNETDEELPTVHQKGRKSNEKQNEGVNVENEHVYTDLRKEESNVEYQELNINNESEQHNVRGIIEFVPLVPVKSNAQPQSKNNSDDKNMKSKEDNFEKEMAALYNDNSRTYNSNAKMKFRKQSLAKKIKVVPFAERKETDETEVKKNMVNTLEKNGQVQNANHDEPVSSSTREESILEQDSVSSGKEEQSVVTNVSVHSDKTDRSESNDNDKFPYMNQNRNEKDNYSENSIFQGSGQNSSLGNANSYKREKLFTKTNTDDLVAKYNDWEYDVLSNANATSTYQQRKRGSVYTIPWKQYIPEQRPVTVKQPQYDESSYNDRLKALKSIYHTKSNHGNNDLNLSRAKTHPSLGTPSRTTSRPPSSTGNLWSQTGSDDGKGERQVTKATIMRRMRNLGIQEVDEDQNMPDKVSKTTAFNILRTRTDLNDQDLTKSSKTTLPPLKGVPKQALPDLPYAWRP